MVPRTSASSSRSPNCRTFASASPSAWIAGSARPSCRYSEPRSASAAAWRYFRPLHAGDEVERRADALDAFGIGPTAPDPALVEGRRAVLWPHEQDIGPSVAELLDRLSVGEQPGLAGGAPKQFAEKTA